MHTRGRYHLVWWWNACDLNVKLIYQSFTKPNNLSYDQRRCLEPQEYFI